MISSSNHPGMFLESIDDKQYSSSTEDADECKKSQNMGSPDANVVVRCQSGDVLLGRGNVRWEGNQRFQAAVRENAQRYNDAQSKPEKGRIVQEIVAIVEAWDGRFLRPLKKQSLRGATSATDTTASIVSTKNTDRRKKKRSRKNDTLWTFADSLTVRKKVGQALRYQFTDTAKYESCHLLPEKANSGYKRKRDSQQEQLHSAVQSEGTGQTEREKVDIDVIQRNIGLEPLDWTFSGQSTYHPTNITCERSRSTMFHNPGSSEEASQVATGSILSNKFFQGNDPWPESEILPDLFWTGTDGISGQCDVAPEKMSTKSRCENDNVSCKSESSASIDVSLSAIIYVEKEEEEWENLFPMDHDEPHVRCSSQSPPLLSDAEILLFLGYSSFIYQHQETTFGVKTEAII